MGYGGGTCKNGVYVRGEARTCSTHVSGLKEGMEASERTEIGKRGLLYMDDVCVVVA